MRFVYFKKAGLINKSDFHSLTFNGVKNSVTWMRSWKGQLGKVIAMVG